MRDRCNGAHRWRQGAGDPSWGGKLEGKGHTRAVEWLPVLETGGSGTLGDGTSGWAHHVARCPRNDGEILVHRLSPALGVQQHELDAVHGRLLEQVLAERAASDAEMEAAQRASNIGGFHGARDLWARPAFEATGLPSRLIDAVQRARAAEAAAMERPPLDLPSLCPTDAADTPEAWFNALPAEGWNALHTHPGRTFSLAYFVSDGRLGAAESEAGGGGADGQIGNAAADGDDGLPIHGCLALIPSGPTNLSDAQRRDHVRRPHSGDAPSANCGAESGSGDEQHLEFLLVDPVPGTCIIFPSFVPHFVIPRDESHLHLSSTDASPEVQRAEPSSDMSHYRISIACNF